MLQSITASNIAVVSHLEVDFHPGLTTFTGETGAGKSLLLDALNLALGARAQLSLIRQGAPDASVTVVFDTKENPDIQTHLEDLGFASHEDTLIIRRIITREGKTKCFINDTPTSVGALKTIGEQLVEIHGQFDRLLLPSHHRSVLDEFGQLTGDGETTRKTHAQWKESVTTLEITRANIQKHEENREYLSFCLKELQDLNPQLDEEEGLLEKRSFLMHYEKLQTGLKTSLYELQEKGHVEQTLNTAYRSLLNTNMEGTLDPLLEKLDASLLSLQETIHALEDKLHDCLPEGEDITLEEIEGRLNALRSLATKHRCTTEELPGLLEQFQREAAILSNAGTEMSALEARVHEDRTRYEKAAHTLSEKRKATATRLKEIIEKELKPLKLHADFSIHFSPLSEEQWSEHGMETVEFHVSTNPGELPGPLSKIASGGELSRLMLALKVSLNQRSHVPTLIFDEVDTGLGGAVADAMGKRLKDLSIQTQVLAITHSPQMAAYANHHYQVAKHLKEDRMQTSILPLDSHEKREEELARMLSGSKITPEAKAAARQLMKELAP